MFTLDVRSVGNFTQFRRQLKNLSLQRCTSTTAPSCLTRLLKNGILTMMNFKNDQCLCLDAPLNLISKNVDCVNISYLLYQVSGGYLQIAQTGANAGALDLLNPLQVTHLPPVWDLLRPLA